MDTADSTTSESTSARTWHEILRAGAPRAGNVGRRCRIAAIALMIAGILFGPNVATAQWSEHCPLADERVDCRDSNACDARRCECDAQGRIVYETHEGHRTRAGNVHDRFETSAVFTYDESGFLICTSLDDDGDDRIDERTDWVVDLDNHVITETERQHDLVQSQIAVTYDESWNPIREDDLQTGTVRTMRYVFDGMGRPVEQYIDDGGDGTENTRIEWSYDDDGVRTEERIDSDVDGVIDSVCQVEIGCVAPYMFCDAQRCRQP